MLEAQGGKLLKMARREMNLDKMAVHKCPCMASSTNGAATTPHVHAAPSACTTCKVLQLRSAICLATPCPRALWQSLRQFFGVVGEAKLLIVGGTGGKAAC